MITLLGNVDFEAEGDAVGVGVFVGVVVGEWIGFSVDVVVCWSLDCDVELLVLDCWGVDVGF